MPGQIDSREMVIDVGKQQVAKVYAQALLAACENAGAGLADAAVEQLTSVVSDVLAQLPEFSALLSSPRVSPEEKDRMLDKAFGTQMLPQLLTFLKVLARRGRLDCLPEMALMARKQLDVLRERTEVTLTTAVPIDAATQELIAERLRVVLGTRVTLKVRVKPEVLGGFVIRVGDTVYDASVATRFQKLRADAVKATEAKIRSELERFVAV